MKVTQRRAAWALAAMGVLLAGCRDEPTALAPDAEAGPAASAARAGQAGRGTTGPEAEFEALEREVPGTGGFFFDERGNLVVVATDTTRGPALRARLEGRLREYRDRLPEHWRGPRGGGRVVVRRGDHSFAQLAAWRDAFSERVAAGPGLVFADADEAENRLTIGITSPGMQAEMRRVAAEAGIPAQALRFEVTGPIRQSVGTAADRAALLASTQTSSTTTGSGTSILGRVRPIVGGVYVEWAKNGGGTWCTLGFTADATPYPGALINSHCSNGEWDTNPENRYYQRPDSTWIKDFTSVTPDLLGSEYYDPDGWACYVGWKCRRSDAAYVSTSFGKTRTGHIAKTTYRSTAAGVNGSFIINQADPRFFVVFERSPAVGEWAEKMGARSGWTGGAITRTGVESWFSDGQWHKKGNQTWAQYYGNNGDSGSPVFAWAGGSRPANEVALLGLHWGRTDDGLSIFSPVANIRDDLGALGTSMRTTVPPPAPPYSVSIGGQTDNPYSGSYQTWTANVTSGTSPFTYRWYRNGAQVSTSQSYTGYVGSAMFELEVQVTDATGAVATASVMVIPGNCDPAAPGECAV